MNERSLNKSRAKQRSDDRENVATYFGIALWALGITCPVSNAAETVQPGFVLHDEGKSNILLSGVSAGELCAEIGGADKVCNTGTKLTVEGNDICIGDDRKPYPCTRYGYRYDYTGATAGTQVECTATRRDPFNQRQKTYTIAIEDGSGSVVQSEWIGYGPVERRTMLTEVHECTYLGEPFATIEYIITYEPSTNPETPTAFEQRPASTVNEPFMPGVPRACKYLDADTASRWVLATVVPYTGANEHMPILRSHCSWFDENDTGRIARSEFKFHVYDLFDTEKRSQDQLLFHATFASGGYAPEYVRTDLGKLTFVYQLAEEDRSAISVVTGIQGPVDGAGRPMELLAHFHLRQPERTHQQRLACLFDIALRSLDYWFSKVDPATNTIKLGEDLPEDFRPTCAPEVI